MSNIVTVYLVDDDEDDRIFFEEALSEISQNTEIFPFSNGVDLMADLHGKIEKLPDILFIDLNMPLMNGEECIEDIRSEQRFEDIPIVVYSTVCDEVQLENLKNIGANGYLQKPNTFAGLKRKLSSNLKNIIKTKSSEITQDRFLIS